MASSEYLAILSAAAAASKKQNTSGSGGPPLASAASSSSQNPTSSSKGSSGKLDLSKFQPSDFPSLSPGPQPPPPPQGRTNESNSEENYGLEGLVQVVRSSASGAALPAQGHGPLLNLGTDLLSLGLELNSSDYLHSKFISPWLDDAKTPLENMLPACYHHHHHSSSSSSSNALAPNWNSLLGKIPLLSEESLFYVFYAMPRDKAQLAAASELWSRGWRFHKGLKLWVCPGHGASSKIQGLFGAGGGVDLQGLESAGERGLWVFFDLNTWQRVSKECVLNLGQIEFEKPQYSSS